ncbi:MAG: orotidine-5'-phosphate decarboxylase [Porticoccaceae bacterium]
MTSETSSPVIVALDYDNSAAALALVDQLDPALCRLKVGKELFTRAGPAFVEQLSGRGFEVFLDLKFHDIPNTTAKAVAAAADLGVWMVNVHASGGRKMMEAAARQLRTMGAPTLLIAVTVLTSMGQDDFAELGVQGAIADHVTRLARLAHESGLHGVVCSAHEAGAIGRDLGDDFLRVTPGIRPAASARDDQQRIMTPSQALAAGSTHLVIGRPITAAENPHHALLEILREVGNH